jgi:hypothetical protein
LKIGRLNLEKLPIRVVARGPAMLWSGGEDLAVFEAGHLGFNDASDATRTGWLNAFRRLLDGLESPLQVVLEVIPGANVTIHSPHPTPLDFDDMRAADSWFVDELAALRSCGRWSVRFVTEPRGADRLDAALRDLGASATRQPNNSVEVFGRQHADRFQGPTGFTRTWYVDRFPGTELEAGWLLRLLPPGFRLRLSWHAVELPTGWIVDYLQRQLVAMRATRMQRDAATPDPVLAGALPAAESLQQRLAASQERAFHVATYLTLRCATIPRLDAGSQAIKAAADAVLCRLEPCTYRMLDGHLATLPIALDRLGRRRVLDTSSLVTFFPWSDAELHERDGLVVGRNRGSGSPVTVDPYDASRYANANMAVFGHSGAGKTYLLSALAMGALGRGVQVYVIDPEHEYGDLARQLGGVDVQLALGSGHALNVLDLRPAERRDESWIGPATADAVDLCAVICGGLDEPERALVESAVRTAYRTLEQPLLRDVANLIPEATRISAVLGRWCEGSLGQMFSAPTNVDLEAPIVAFGMRELRDEMIAPVHFLLAEALWTRIKRKDRRRMLIVDELGLLFEDATIRRFVVNLARRVRKYHGSLVFATQNPGDLLASEQGAVVATNPALAFLGAQRPGEAAKLQHHFDLSDRQRAALESARRGEFLLIAGRERLMVNVQAPPWQEDVMANARGPGPP